MSDVERRILALPVRYGGLGIANPVLTADRKYNVSVDLTENLTNIIYNQERSLDNYDKEGLKNRINIHKAAKEQHPNDEYNEISTLVNSNLKRSMELARERKDLVHG